MNRKISTILISCVLILISVILLIVFLVIPRNVSNAVKPLTVYSQDYDLLVGEEINNFYVVSKESANISFEVENENVVKIEGMKLIAEKPGHTRITIKAKDKEEQAQTTIEVNVYLPDFSLNVKPVYNCLYQDNQLYCYGEFCQFQLEIIDKNNNILSNVELITECQTGEIYREFLNWTLIINENSQITVYVKDINYKFILNVILINSLK